MPLPCMDIRPPCARFSVQTTSRRAYRRQTTQTRVSCVFSETIRRDVSARSSPSTTLCQSFTSWQLILCQIHDLQKPLSLDTKRRYLRNYYSPLREKVLAKQQELYIVFYLVQNKKIRHNKPVYYSYYLLEMLSIPYDGIQVVMCFVVIPNGLHIEDN